jgi:hypothetical protein
VVASALVPTSRNQRKKTECGEVNGREARLGQAHHSRSITDQSLHRAFDLQQILFGYAVRREEGDRGVTPVIDFSGRSILSVESKHRKKFDGGDPEILKIWNLLDQAGVRTSEPSLDARIWMLAAHMHLVDDGP